MKTSYEGCHPDIAESLKRGEHARCISKDGAAETKMTICAYDASVMASYICTGRMDWDTAEPVPTETYVIDAVSMMEGLVKRKWEQQSDGSWRQPNGFVTAPTIFFECGARPTHTGGYHDWMLVERDV